MSRRRKLLLIVVAVVAIVAVLGYIGARHKKNQNSCVTHQLILESSEFTTSGINAALKAYPRPYNGPDLAPSVNDIEFARGACGESP